VTFVADLGAAVPLVVGAFLAAAVLALLLTPPVRALASRLDLVDVPEARRVNTRPVPRGGGVAVVIAFVLVAAIALAWTGATRTLAFPFSLDGPAIIALLAGGIAAAMIGAIDDYLQLRARWQLLGQLVLAVWAVGLGATVDVLTNPLSDRTIVLPDLVSAGFTVFWIVGMMNAINFIDGLDGLSSGIGLIAAVTLGLVSLTTAVSQPVIAVLCFALAGALLGFLRWNFHPAAIFAGTSGTMFLGYTLALLSIVGTAKVPVALLVLGVPIIDTFWIIVRRLAAGRMPFSPDRGHIHHRLLDLGLSHRQVVLVIYGMCGVLAAVALFLPGRTQVYAFLGLALATGLVFLLLTRRAISPGGLEAASYEADPTAARTDPLRTEADQPDRPATGVEALERPSSR
jgi:UDP-GlcNAc:undecaprenyl-phosphate GlcNAc-1-phosphate transferase